MSSTDSGSSPGGSSTPQEAAIGFLSAWRDQRWATMGRYVQLHRRAAAVGRGPVDVRLRGLYGNKRLREFSIVEVLDLYPGLTEVRARVRYSIGETPFVPILRLNVIRETPAGAPIARDVDAPGAEWGVNEISALREVDR